MLPPPGLALDAPTSPLASPGVHRAVSHDHSWGGADTPAADNGLLDRFGAAPASSPRNKNVDENMGPAVQHQAEAESEMTLMQIEITAHHTGESVSLSRRRLLRTSANYLIRTLRNAGFVCCICSRELIVPCLALGASATLPTAEALTPQHVYALITLASSAAVIKQFWKTTEAVGDSGADVIRVIGENSMLTVDAVAEVQKDWIRQAGSCGSCLIWSTALLAAYLFLAQVKKCLQ